MSCSRVAAAVLSIAMVGGIGAFSGGDVSAQQIEEISECTGKTAPEELSFVVAEMFKLTNDKRKQNGSNEVAFDCAMSMHSTQWGRHLQLTNNVQHDRFHVVDYYNGENIYWSDPKEENGALVPKSMLDTITAWMNSQGHRDNLLNNSHKTMGVGIAYSTNQEMWVVQRFKD